MATLLITLHHGDVDHDLKIQVDGPALVGDVVDAVVRRTQMDRVPSAPSFSVERTKERLARDTRVVDADLRSGDRLSLCEASGLSDRYRVEAAAQAQIVDGPGTGMSYDLPSGPSDIGRSEACNIRIKDRLASRRHARVMVADDIHIADLGSTNGILIDDEFIFGTSKVSADDLVTIGETTMQFCIVERTERTATRPVVEFNRPPHVFRAYEGAKIQLPAPPDDPPKQRLPMIAALIPLLLVGILYGGSDQVLENGWPFSPFMLVFMAFSPVMMIGSYLESKRSGRLNHKDRVAEHAELIRRKRARLDAERETEIASRAREFPSGFDAEQFASTLSARLWERHVDEPEFLALRAGRAEQDSRTTVTVRSGGSRRLRDEMAGIPALYARIPKLPAVVHMDDMGGLGLAGPIDRCNHLIRSLMVQLAGLHSPNELVITALFGSQEALEWKWLGWLPHVRSTVTPISGSHFGTDPHTCQQLLSELLAEVKRRSGERRNGGSDGPPPLPVIVTIIDESAPLDRTRLAPLLEAGPSMGLFFIWIGSSWVRLPHACGAVIDLSTDSGNVSLAFRDSGRTMTDVTIEGMGLDRAEAFARSLCPVVEVGGRVGVGATVPSAASLVELLDGADILDDPDAIIARWIEAEESVRKGKRLNLRAPIGLRAEAPLSIDIRTDGPHALVAGTTGAGKSELLQSYVASLAANHSSRRITFLLVDYKGGAAFRDCAKLPHTVGLVTDLDTTGVRRALMSLEAELKYREIILNKAGARDLVEMERNLHPSTPTTLMVMVDEFAALVKEVPEFIEGVVDVALRGRSLGIHLVLATQRPAGVVTPQIRANTNLRIALRVADDDDSVDVIGTKDAAGLDPALPGRAIAKLGPRDPVLFQAAYVGGVTDAAATGPAVHVSRLLFDRTGPLASLGHAPPGGTTEASTDLQRLVLNIARAHDKAGFDPPRLPWLAPLAAVYDLADLPRSETDEQIVIGLADDPHRQRQNTAHFAPDQQGSMLVMGASGSGKTVLLRTLASSAAMSRSSTTTHIYGLDFAGRGLEMLGDLPHVGTIVLGHDNERVVRLLRDLRSWIDDRSDRFSAMRAGSLPEYRSSVRDRREPRILVLVDGYPAFHSTYERVEAGKWIDWLTQLVADGRRCGVHFALTADRRSAFPLALASAVPGRLVLRLASPDDYSMAGVPLDIVTRSSPPGRAIFEDLETQVALFGGDVSGDAQAQAMKEFAKRLKACGHPPAPPVRILPDEVDLTSVASNGHGFAFGLRDSDLQPAVLDFNPGGFIVTGPPRSGKTTALEALVATRPSGVRGAVIVVAHENKLITPRPSSRVAIGVDDGASLLREVADASDENLLVVVDDLHDLANSDADHALADVVRAARTRRLMIVVSSSPDAARRAFSGPLKDVRASRSGLLLQPDTDTDGDIVGVRLPRAVNPVWPPGRGYLAIRGTIELCQVGIGDDQGRVV